MLSTGPRRYARLHNAPVSVSGALAPIMHSTQALGGGNEPLYIASKDKDGARFAPLKAAFPTHVFGSEVLKEVLPGVHPMLQAAIEQARPPALMARMFPVQSDAACWHAFRFRLVLNTDLSLMGAHGVSADTGCLISLLMFASGWLGWLPLIAGLPPCKFCLLCTCDSLKLKLKRHIQD